MTKSENPKHKIPLGKNFLVIEIDQCGEPGVPPECWITVETDSGVILQNVAIARPHHYLDRAGQKFVVDPNFVDVLVWSDQYNEDYTHKYKIPVADEEEE